MNPQNQLNQNPLYQPQYSGDQPVFQNSQPQILTVQQGSQVNYASFQGNSQTLQQNNYEQVQNQQNPNNPQNQQNYSANDVQNLQVQNQALEAQLQQMRMQVNQLIDSLNGEFNYSLKQIDQQTTQFNEEEINAMIQNIQSQINEQSQLNDTQENQKLIIAQSLQQLQTQKLENQKNLEETKQFFQWKQ